MTPASRHIAPPPEKITPTAQQITAIPEKNAPASEKNAPVGAPKCSTCLRNLLRRRGFFLRRRSSKLRHPTPELRNPSSEVGYIWWFSSKFHKNHNPRCCSGRGREIAISPLNSSIAAILPPLPPEFIQLHPIPSISRELGNGSHEFASAASREPPLGTGRIRTTDYADKHG